MPEKVVSPEPKVSTTAGPENQKGIWFHIRDYLHHLSLFSKEARLFLLGTFFVAYTFAVYQLLLNLYLKELGFKEGFIGSLLSATALGTLAISIPLVYLMHRVSYRTILVASVLSSAASYALLSLLLHQTGLWLAAFFSGASAAGLRLVAPPFFMR